MTASIEVWAIGDGVRIDPETGRAFEQDPEILPGGLQDGYREANSVWDGESVVLSAARNEVVSFQVIVEAPGGARDVEVKASDLRCVSGAGGAIESRHVKLFREWYIHARQAGESVGPETLDVGQPPETGRFALRTGWYPDPLIPLDSPKFGAPFEIPSQDFRNPAGEHPRQVNQAVWADLYVPPGTPPGEYAGEISIAGSAGDDFRVALPVKLTVWEIDLPNENHMDFDLMCYGKDVVPQPDGLEYYRMIHRHRGTLNAKDLTPTVVNGGAPDATFDWTQFDEKWSGLFDGSAFTDGPGQGVPLGYITLRFDHAWPGYAMFIPADFPDPAGLAAALAEPASDAERFLAERLSENTRKLIQSPDPSAEELVSLLVDDFNRIILNEDLRTAEGFQADVEDLLSVHKDYYQGSPPVPRANRLILEKLLGERIAQRKARYVPGDPAADKLYQRLMKDWEDHFAEKGWTRTRLIVWSDTLDEPKFHHDDEERAFRQLRDLQKFGELVHTSGAKGVTYRLDIGGGFAPCRYDLDGDGKVEGTKDVVNALADSIDLWNIHGNCIDAGLLRPLLEAGKAQAWFYNGYRPRIGTKYINEEAVGLRSWPWTVWVARISGCCDWHFMFKVRQRELFYESNDDETPGNAQYIYPGEQIGLSGPLPSIRLKIIRRGIQDYEYLWLLGRAGGDERAADEIALGVAWQTLGAPVGPIISDDLVEKVDQARHADRVDWTPAWEHDPDKWAAARDALAEAIERSGG